MTRPQSNSDYLRRRLIQFSCFLRDHGQAANPGSVVDAHRVALLGYFTDRPMFKAGLKACFCVSREDWQSFDLLFDSFWATDLARVDDHDDSGEPPVSPPSASDRESSQNRLVGFAGVSSQEMEDPVAGAGDFKALSLADFRFVFDPVQQREIARLVDKLAQRCRRHYFRKYKIRSSGYRIAMNKSLQKSMRNPGYILNFKYRRRQKRLPRYVLLLDISQSMDVYSKIFLRFTRQVLSVFEQSEAFAFNTQLMPLGRGFSQLTEEAFEARLSQMSDRWHGGTRIASSLREFNEDHVRSSVNLKTTVVVFSDGFDTSGTDELITELDVIKRRCGKLVWVNPLLGRFTEGEPDRNMDPLQPYIDCYRSAHNLESLKLLESDLLVG